MELNKISKYTYEIPQEKDMNVPGRVYTSEKLIEELKEDNTLQQVKNVAKLPSIQKHSTVMPDGHQGFGVPIGGVAAFNGKKGIISPGAVGFDINCGVRLLKTNLKYKDIEGKEKQIANFLYSKVPTGLGKGSIITINDKELEKVLNKGVKWMHENGYATKKDLENCEENGQLSGSHEKVPENAKDRGKTQLGSLGSGNHFLELQKVDNIFNEQKAEAYGLEKNQIVIMIHCGSRGLGHQTCEHYTDKFKQHYKQELDNLPDEKLVYGYLNDDLGQDYQSAMNAAANYAWANRQAITHHLREKLPEIVEKTKIELLYDVSHNIAKTENHKVDGSSKEVVVHRKGATRAFPPGHEEIPEKYQKSGQPVLIPGSMGTSSYVLSGGQKSMELSFGSTAHGAGRLRSRTQARNENQAERISKEMENKGVFVKASSNNTIAEEAPTEYKDVDEVIKISHELGIAEKVAQLRPVINIKG